MAARLFLRNMLFSTHLFSPKACQVIAASKACQLNLASSMTQIQDNFVFRQMFETESSTYTYILGDKLSKEAILIDPVLETVDRDLSVLQMLGLRLKFAINTHMHADHITGTGKIKEKLPETRSVISAASGALADVYLKDGDTVEFGGFNIEARYTPGHTNGCMTFVNHHSKKVFSGDALLIGGCGRTDFQEGNPGTLYKSVHSQIFTLPNDYHIYPAHDYRGLTVTTVEEEKNFNPRLTRTQEDFERFMNEELKLAYPKKIDVAVPWNKVCGIQEKVQLPE